MDCELIQQSDGRFVCSFCGRPLSVRARRNCVARPKGPGTILHEIIKKYAGADTRKGCGCEELVREMNELGVEGCRRHVELIVDHMMGEAAKRGWRLARLRCVNLVTYKGAKLLVYWAIKRAEKEAKDFQCRIASIKAKD